MICHLRIFHRKRLSEVSIKENGVLKSTLQNAVLSIENKFERRLVEKGHAPVLEHTHTASVLDDAIRFLDRDSVEHQPT